jgi:hypothetical protein
LHGRAPWKPLGPRQPSEIVGQRVNSVFYSRTSCLRQNTG